MSARVLVVDDEPQIIRALVTNLRARGYDVDSARYFVLDDINAVLAEWGSPRRVSEEAAGGEE